MFVTTVKHPKLSASTVLYCKTKQKQQKREEKKNMVQEDLTTLPQKKIKKINSEMGICSHGCRTQQICGHTQLLCTVQDLFDWHMLESVLIETYRILV